MSDEEADRPDRYHRAPGGPFEDHKKELYAQSRAKGAGIGASSGFAGIAKPTGSKWERHPEMLGRIAELRSGAQTFVGVSKGWLMDQLKETAKEAREASQLKTAKECYELMYEIVNTDKDLAGDMARALPPNASIASIRKQYLESVKTAPALPDHAPPTIDDLLDAEGEEVEVA